MSDSLNISSSASSSGESTANPQQISQSNFQGLSSSQLQNSNSSLSLDNSSAPSSSIVLKNFSLSTLSLDGQNTGSIAAPTTSLTNQTKHLSSLSVVLICILVVMAITSFVLATRSNKTTTK